MSESSRRPSSRSILGALRCGAAVLVAVVAGAATGAAASDRWEEAGSGAVAILPAPVKSAGVLSASLACAEQRWGLRLRTDAGKPATSVEATVTVDRRTFAATAVREAVAVQIPVPFDILNPLRAGTRLTVSVSGAEGAEPIEASFNLRGSRNVIDAIAPRCSPINMDGFDRVDMVETGEAVTAAEALVADAVKDFRTATSSTPKLSAALVKPAPDRDLLFAMLCGSTWYYGRSGCNLSGFARDTASGDWRHVYSSEGMTLYLDPQVSRAGWPDLRTLALVNGLEPVAWAWNGTVYTVSDATDPAADVAAETPSVEAR
jgi:hypothetical protein